MTNQANTNEGQELQPFVPFNPRNRKEYFGQVLKLLQEETNQKEYSSLEWASFDDWKALGETVAKGEKAIAGTFYKRNEGDDAITYFEFNVRLFNRCQLISFKAISNKA
jgi:antirestriction protein ArdC